MLDFKTKNENRKRYFGSAKEQNKSRALEARAARRNRLNGAFGNEQNQEVKDLLLFGTVGTYHRAPRKKASKKAASSE